MFLGICMYLCLIGSKRLAFPERSFMVLGSIYMSVSRYMFHERSCMVFGSVYVSLFNSNYRLALHESSSTVFGVYV